MVFLSNLKNKWQNRKKHYFIRKIVKEIKRVRWPDWKTNRSNFVKILIFTAIFTLFVFAIVLLFTSIWTALGVN
ncbi:preprotein translocase subunit SecE [Mycoplasmopsis gallinacea]|uniref:Protein translocase subunit SecE n=1 Tax=Mycoplasmopsis gallinacea TaxID=29556 RepID=A0A0D5ZIX8_9BACT|nr:preprotein translocase subunit SecE [Mycoplasmopsis gallinacea]AKA49878.1 preprotein translocase subunit SecE [Mycoplasmopsis gallinacea]QIW62241.1 preprotein translocase subunit SecE [Mycoplasmopsis gallinacea]VEU58896.1 Uncharacterised protein [Mycoplasmopsis gallinacea]